MLSKTSNYGIKAVLFIANESQQGRRVGVPVIAENINAPQYFTGKIVQQLAKAKLLNSIKGPNGGFEMTKAQQKGNNIRSIVEILDGDDLYTKCGLGLEQCNSSDPCPIHSSYVAIRSAIIEMHTRLNIEELSKKLDDVAVLK